MPIVKTGDRISLICTIIPTAYDDDGKRQYDAELIEALGPELEAARTANCIDSMLDACDIHGNVPLEMFVQSAKNRCTHAAGDDACRYECAQLTRLAAGINGGGRLHVMFLLLPVEETRRLLAERAYELRQVFGKRPIFYTPPARWVQAECEMLGLDDYLEYARLRIAFPNATLVASEGPEPLEPDAHRSYVTALKQLLVEDGEEFDFYRQVLRALQRVREVELEDELAEPIPTAPLRMAEPTGRPKLVTEAR